MFLGRFRHLKLSSGDELPLGPLAISCFRALRLGRVVELVLRLYLVVFHERVGRARQVLDKRRRLLLLEVRRVVFGSVSCRADTRRDFFWRVC